MAAHADEPRIAAAYTAWDDYYFYAAFVVNDHNVISTNRTPISQPQEDDDIEVFLNTGASSASTVRTADTYQMAVSAGSGAYFSVGDGSKIPKGKLVLTYKYAVTIDGTLNDPSDNDTGFTVELAIPWQELGLAGPPTSGQVWGFNEISRNRESMSTPAQSFASLSPNVLNSDDIQNPSKWTKIQFITTLANQVSGPSEVYCPRITSDTNFPVIDGVVRSGEWNTDFGYSFGSTMIAGAAPTQAEEPNITTSPFATVEEPVIQTPEVEPATPATPAATPPPNPGYMLSLPGGGEIHVGKLPPPPPIVPPPPAPATVGSGHHKYSQYPGSDTNPLAPNLPPEGEVGAQIGPTIDPNASLSLVAQQSVAPLIVAPYIYSYPADLPLTQFLDQPMEGVGPAFGGDRTQWHRSQLADARRSGIDVLLPIVDSADPDSAAGLAALVEAMKEMKADGEDYPLLGIKVEGDAVAAVREFLTIVPAEFRAEVVLPDKELDQPAFIVFADTLPDVAAIKKVAADEFNNFGTVLVTTPAGKDYLQIAAVSPGGLDANGALAGRSGVETLNASWSQVYDSDANWVYVNSWNDFTNGTEVAASRQYGEQFADQTKLAGLKWSGADQWDAKYLQNNVPTLIAQKTLYTVSIRVENNGSLPWRAGEDYALCYRWYKDGRLYDDSAPRIPLPDDIYPGESTTVNIGVVAQNSYGSDIDPGVYTLVFDMVQGQDRWFSYVGSRPLRIPVRVEDPIDSPAAKAVVISSSTPSLLDTAGTYLVTVQIRNEGQETWNGENTQLTLEGNRAAGASSLEAPVNPGAIGYFSLPIEAPAGLTAGKIGTITWSFKTPGTLLTWNENPMIVSSDPGASFSVNDIQRTMKTAETSSAKVALYNLGPYTWDKSSWKVGYEWFYLDGVPATAPAATGSFDTNVAAGVETGASLTYRAPDYPGKYQLVLYLTGPNGVNTLFHRVTRGVAVLPMIVSVVADKSAAAQTVDLSKYYNTRGAGYESTAGSSDFDGKGDCLPGAFMPPDGTQELNVNPLINGKTGPAEYPSGYYSSSAGDDEASNHRIAFFYAPKDAADVIAAKGQQIDLPAGNWSAIHLLMAATGSADTGLYSFSVNYKDGTEPKSVSVANWTKVPAPAVATVGLRLPYYLSNGAVASAGPVFLGDYSLNVDSSRHLSSLTLPSDPTLKVVAITVER